MQDEAFEVSRLIRSRAGSLEFCGVEGIFRHFQIDEDEVWLAVESAHDGGDAGGFGAYDADGEAPEAGGVFGADSSSDAAAALVPAAVEDGRQKFLERTNSPCLDPGATLTFL